MPDSALTSESIQMLIASVTQNGHAHLEAIQVERLLNAVARAQLGVPTGAPNGAEGLPTRTQH